MKARTKSDEIAAIRLSMLREQDNICPICGKVIEEDQAVLDHQHSNGRIRGVLHRRCNSLEGRLGTDLKRFAGLDINDPKDTLFITEQVALILEYVQDDYSNNRMHPTHRFAEHRRITILTREMKAAKRPETAQRKKDEIKALRKIIKAKYKT